MVSTSDIAKTLLMGWRLKGTSVDVYLRTLDMNVDSTGIITDSSDAHLTIALSDTSGTIRLFLSGASLDSFVPPKASPIEPDKTADCVAGVVIMRDGKPVCALFEMPAKSIS